MTTPGVGPHVTIVIPAHNEQAVIGRCLSTMFSDGAADDIDVLVVSNGSTDATVEMATKVASALGHDVTVVELSTPSKIQAIREGIRRAAGNGVIVVDADVELPPDALRNIVAGVSTDCAVVVSARLRVDTSRSSWLVERYYRVWTRLPYVRRGMVGSGVFGLSRAALADLGEIPDVTNDDGWVRRSFPPEQRIVVAEEFTSHAARSVGALAARRARIINGNHQLDQQTSVSDGDGTSWGVLGSLLRSREASPVDVMVFVGVTVASRLLAAWRRLRRDHRWSTDQTSRTLG